MKSTISDSQLLDAYNRTGSVWKTADELGRCGKSVWERLTKLGAIESNAYSQSQRKRIVEVYKTGILRGDGKLDLLSKEIGIHKSNISRWARLQGLTDKNCSVAPGLAESNGDAVRKWHSDNVHPKGMLGKHHSESTKKRLSEKSSEYFANETVDQKSDRVERGLRTREANGTLYNQTRKTSWKSGWRTIGGQRCYFRSRWEANYARFLQSLKDDSRIDQWEHEPETFWFEGVKQGVRSYLPDFRVIDGPTIYYVEVKGWMDSKSKMKLKRMKEYHPKIVLQLVDSKAYRSLEKTAKHTVDGWET